MVDNIAQKLYDVLIEREFIHDNDTGKNNYLSCGSISAHSSGISVHKSDCEYVEAIKLFESMKENNE